MVRLAGCAHSCVFVRLALSKMTSALKETGVAFETLPSAEAAVILVLCCGQEVLETFFGFISAILLWGYHSSVWSKKVQIGNT